jgi:hypothetical protein
MITQIEKEVQMFKIDDEVCWKHGIGTIISLIKRTALVESKEQ